MSSEEPPPFRPWVIPVIVLVVDFIAIVVLGGLGFLKQLSPAVQFYFGASSIAFPLIIYIVLKKREERDREKW